MAVSLVHTTAATGTDSGDGKISKNAWNEAHTLTGAADKLLGFDGSGDAVEYTIGAAAAGNILDRAAGDGRYQPLDADLTAIAALTTTAFGRGFLDLADAAAGRTKLGLGTAALSASGDFQPIDADLTAIAALTTTVYGRGLLTLADDAALTALINPATATLSGAMPAADKIKVDALLNAVKFDANGSARGSAIADYFDSSISLEASSIYEIEVHAYFLKTTAGTVTWTWAFSSAPTMSTSRYQSTPITGFTTTTITGAEIFAEATVEGATTMAHAASGSLSNNVRHSFIFRLRLRTNAATTVQLRCTESAGTLTPQAGSYMYAVKVV